MIKCVTPVTKEQMKSTKNTKKKEAQKNLQKTADDQVHDARDQGSSPFDCLLPQLLNPAGY
jgi:hypothetical protein